MKIDELDLELLSPAERSAFKRAAGQTIAQSQRTLGMFYAKKPYSVSQWDEEAFFAALCMACLWKDDQRGRVLPMEQCLAIIAENDSLKRRVNNVLDTAWDPENGNMLSVKLARLARMLRSGDTGISPDFDLLYRDLCFWNAPGRSVQKRWARDFYTPKSEE